MTVDVEKRKEACEAVLAQLDNSAISKNTKEALRRLALESLLFGAQNVPSRLMRQRRELGPRRLKDPFSLPYRSQTQSWEQVSPQRLCFFSAVLGLQCGL